jgi:hypothetical protein
MKESRPIILRHFSFGLRHSDFREFSSALFAFIHVIRGLKRIAEGVKYAYRL